MWRLVLELVAAAVIMVLIFVACGLKKKIEKAEQKIATKEKLLLRSDDYVKIVTEENATLINCVNGFRDKLENSEKEIKVLKKKLEDKQDRMRKIFVAEQQLPIEEIVVKTRVFITDAETDEQYQEITNSLTRSLHEELIKRGAYGRMVECMSSDPFYKEYAFRLRIVKDY